MGLSSSTFVLPTEVQMCPFKSSYLTPLLLSPRRKREHEAFLDLFSADLCQEIAEEVIKECVKETASSEIQ